jgi:hypothetical protein
LTQNKYKKQARRTERTNDCKKGSGKKKRNKERLETEE